MIIDTNDMCPSLLLQFKTAYDKAGNGEVIEVRTPWYAAVQELGKLCEVLGCRVIDHREEKGRYVIKVLVVK